LGYSLQGNRKTKEGSSHPDRDAQFRYIHDQVENFQRRDNLLYLLTRKKKELVGDFKNEAKSGDLKVIQSRYVFMILSISYWGKPTLMGYMIRQPMRGGQRWGPTMTLLNLQLNHCDGGGHTWVMLAIRWRRSCL